MSLGIIEQNTKDSLIVTANNRDLQKACANALSRGKIRRISSRVYTNDLTRDPTEIIRDGKFSLVSRLFPGAIISHKSGLIGGFIRDQDGNYEVVITTKAKPKTLKMPGLKIHLLNGPERHKDDMPMMGLYLSSPQRAYLENMQVRSGKVQNVEEIEKGLLEHLTVKGQDSFKRLIDQVHQTSEHLKMTSEAIKFQKIAGALLGTQPASNLSLKSSIAAAQGTPYDVQRLETFEILSQFLRQHPLPEYPLPDLSLSAKEGLAFYDAYFSNYIEGTQFLTEEAKEIALEEKVPKHRPDGYDLLSAYKIIKTFTAQEASFPNDPKEIITLIKSDHSTFMARSLEKHPGQFKSEPNRAGNTLFVFPALVPETLRIGFEMALTLPKGLAQGLMCKFIISEVHPFVDGNGRISRIILNRILYSEGLYPIIVPTVFRSDYLGALTVLSSRKDPLVYVKAMTRVANFAKTIDISSFESIETSFKKANAFSADPSHILSF